jgi:hypothetical protein
MAQSLINKALKGDYRAVDKVLKIIGEVSTEQKLSCDERTLDAMLDRMSEDEVKALLDGIRALGASVNPNLNVAKAPPPTKAEKMKQKEAMEKFAGKPLNISEDWEF